MAYDVMDALDTEYLTTVIQNVTSFPRNFILAGQNLSCFTSLSLIKTLRLCQSMTSTRLLKILDEKLGWLSCEERSVERSVAPVRSGPVY